MSMGSNPTFLLKFLPAEQLDEEDDDERQNEADGVEGGRVNGRRQVRVSDALVVAEEPSHCRLAPHVEVKDWNKNSGVQG